MPVAASPTYPYFSAALPFLLQTPVSPQWPYCSSCRTEPCEELELRLLKDEQHLLLQLLWILRLSRKALSCRRRGGKALQSACRWSFCRSRLRPTRADDLMLTGRKKLTTQRGYLRPSCRMYSRHLRRQAPSARFFGSGSFSGTVISARSSVRRESVCLRSTENAFASAAVYFPLISPSAMTQNSSAMSAR